MRAPHSARVVDVSEASFQQLSSPAQQSFAPVSSDAPPIAIHCSLLARFALPVTPSPLRLGNVRPHSDLSQVFPPRPAMISLVRHHLFHALRVHPLIRRRFFSHFL